MKQRQIIFLTTTLFCLFLSGHPNNEFQKLLKTHSVSSEEACLIKKGYWHNCKCWAHFNNTNPNISKDLVMCLGKEQGKAFYFRTLEAAPFDDMHYMSDSAIQAWRLATNFIQQPMKRS